MTSQTATIHCKAAAQEVIAVAERLHAANLISDEALAEAREVTVNLQRIAEYYADPAPLLSPLPGRTAYMDSRDVVLDCRMRVMEALAQGLIDIAQPYPLCMHAEMGMGAINQMAPGLATLWTVTA